MTCRLRCTVALLASTLVYGGIWYELYRNQPADRPLAGLRQGVSSILVSFMPRPRTRAEAPKPPAKRSAPEESMDAVEEMVHAPEVPPVDAQTDVEVPVADPVPRLRQRKVAAAREESAEPAVEIVRAEKGVEEKKEQKEKAQPAHSGNPGVRSVLRAADNPRISYPPKMVEREIEGRVRVKVWLADDGSVDRLVILEKDPHNEFNREVQNTVMRWKAERVGKTDRVLTIAVRFWLQGGRPSVSPWRSG